jgi:hypothetical protein
MYPHVGPFTPYFGFGYEDIRSVLTMWPPMSNPLANPIVPPKPILGIAQVGIIIDQEELQMSMKTISKENTKMP